MIINLSIDEKLLEDVVDFRIRSLTPKIQKVIDYLNTKEPEIVVGYKSDEIVLVKPEEIVVFFTEGKKICARLVGGEVLTIKERLYEVEERLGNSGFIRISNSSIANAKMIRKLQMASDGSLCIIFNDESREFASRRSVKNLKSYLGIGGKNE